MRESGNSQLCWQPPVYFEDGEGERAEDVDAALGVKAVHPPPVLSNNHLGQGLSLEHLEVELNAAAAATALPLLAFLVHAQKPHTLNKYYNWQSSIWGGVGWIFKLHELKDYIVCPSVCPFDCPSVDHPIWNLKVSSLSANHSSENMLPVIQQSALMINKWVVIQSF